MASVLRRPRRGPMHEVTVIGDRILSAEQAAVVRVEISNAFRQRQEQSRLQRRLSRLPAAPERASVSRAMLAVEERLVKAFWTIARQPARRISPSALSRCGIEYLHDRSDVHSIYADAAGGKWDAIAPRPPVPSGKEIDAANGALDWLLYLEDSQRKLLVAGATSKRGDAGRQINWTRLREGMPELSGLSARTLRWRYRDALRIIVIELTENRIAAVA